MHTYIVRTYIAYIACVCLQATSSDRAVRTYTSCACLLYTTASEADGRKAIAGGTAHLEFHSLARDPAVKELLGRGSQVEDKSLRGKS